MSIPIVGCKHVEEAYYYAIDPQEYRRLIDDVIQILVINSLDYVKNPTTLLRVTKL